MTSKTDDELFCGNKFLMRLLRTYDPSVAEQLQLSCDLCPPLQAWLQTVGPESEQVVSELCKVVLAHMAIPIALVNYRMYAAAALQIYCAEGLLPESLPPDTLLSVISAAVSGRADGVPHRPLLAVLALSESIIPALIQYYESQVLRAQLSTSEKDKTCEPEN